jgi:hypothetical protein
MATPVRTLLLVAAAALVASCSYCSAFVLPSSGANAAASAAGRPRSMTTGESGSLPVCLCGSGLLHTHACQPRLGPSILTWGLTVHPPTHEHTHVHTHARARTHTRAHRPPARGDHAGRVALDAGVPQEGAGGLGAEEECT